MSDARPAAGPAPAAVPAQKQPWPIDDGPVGMGGSIPDEDCGFRPAAPASRPGATPVSAESPLVQALAAEAEQEDARLLAGAETVTPCPRWGTCFSHDCTCHPPTRDRAPEPVAEDVHRTPVERATAAGMWGAIERAVAEGMMSVTIYRGEAEALLREHAALATLRPPAPAGAGEDDTGYWRCVEEAVHALREPLTLADARAARQSLTTALVAHKKAKVRARRPAADTPTTEGREDA